MNVLRLRINALLKSVEAAIAEEMNVEQHKALNDRMVAVQDMLMKDLMNLSLEIREADLDNV